MYRSTTNFFKLYKQQTQRLKTFNALYYNSGIKGYWRRDNNGNTVIRSTGFNKYFKLGPKLYYKFRTLIYYSRVGYYLVFFYKIFLAIYILLLTPFVDFITTTIECYNHKSTPTFILSRHMVPSPTKVFAIYGHGQKLTQHKRNRETILFNLEHDFTEHDFRNMQRILYRGNNQIFTEDRISKPLQIRLCMYWQQQHNIDDYDGMTGISKNPEFAPHACMIKLSPSYMNSLSKYGYNYLEDNYRNSYWDTPNLSDQYAKYMRNNHVISRYPNPIEYSEVAFDPFFSYMVYPEYEQEFKARYGDNWWQIRYFPLPAKDLDIKTIAEEILFNIAETNKIPHIYRMYQLLQAYAARKEDVSPKELQKTFPEFLKFYTLLTYYPQVDTWGELRVTPTTINSYYIIGLLATLILFLYTLLLGFLVLSTKLRPTPEWKVVSYIDFECYLESVGMMYTKMASILQRELVPFSRIPINNYMSETK
jgi:hypothetical protein